ncbi:peptide chain release factor N(5)-glutamine methyltransferase [Pseudoclavibacter sp. 8L]|uniref:peptide chain release factor N(5)-glutamine methyltransferase n=1 Tax=Pseudoclavibacter sp. 8L TaxID=2653162 RepID=UPI0012EF5DD9|nr:peptide chain release factor N(5)-glutamine methyltransferase [Pseudoclavibacter sp. 8L]VXB40043.1 Release factor glutamine methyltransferase [Pseudoclavibacter sp. 8L]
MILYMDELRKRVREQLKTAGIADERTEADVLLAAVLRVSRGEVQMRSLLGRAVSEADALAVGKAASRRARREPLQHVTGRAPFIDMELAVGPGAFVPRPETESLVMAAVEHLGGAESTPAKLTGVDVGSGTGAVALGVARLHGGITMTAIERSSAAWPWLRSNVESYGEGAVATFFGDAARAFAALPSASLDLVVSNPPYVPAANRPESREVWHHDPEAALYSGADGLDFIRRLATWSARALRPEGVLVIEHEDSQGAEIREIFANAGFSGAATARDLTGRDRITSAVRSASNGDAPGRPAIM